MSKYINDVANQGQNGNRFHFGYSLTVPTPDFVPSCSQPKSPTMNFMISYHFYGSKEPLQDISKFHQWEGPYFSPEKSGFFPKNKNKLLPRGGIEPSSSE